MSLASNTHAEFKKEPIYRLAVTTLAFVGKNPKVTPLAISAETISHPTLSSPNHSRTELANKLDLAIASSIAKSTMIPASMTHHEVKKQQIYSLKIYYNE